MAALGELLDQLGVEGRQVVRLAAGDQTLVDHLPVDPFGTGVPEVGADRRPRGHGAAAHHVGLDQQPGSVADRADRLAGFEEGVGEGDRRGLDAQLVGVDLAARQHEAVIALGPRVLEIEIDRDLLAPVGLVPAADGAGLGCDHMHGGAGLLERALGLRQLRLLEAVGRQDRNGPAVQIVRHVGCSFQAWQRPQGALPDQPGERGATPRVPEHLPESQ
jgi:hypothetical protein